MKKVIILILIIAAAILIAPKIVGTQYQSYYEEMLNKASEHSGLKVELAKYENHWFGSEAQINVTLNLPEMQQPVVVTVNEAISHGPLLMTDQGFHAGLGYSRYHFDMQGSELTAEDIAQINQKLHLSNLVGFGGDMLMLLQTEQIELDESGEAVVIKPVKGHFATNNNARDLTGQLNWQGLEAKSADAVFSVGASRIDYDLTVVSGQLMQGTAMTEGSVGFKVASVDADNKKTNQSVNLKDISIAASSDFNAKLVDSKLEYLVGQFKGMNETINNGRLVVEINNLDSEVITEFNQINNQIQQQGGAVDPSAAMAQMSALLPKLLANDPVLRISDFSADVAEGKMQGQMEIKIDKDKFDPNNMMSAMLAVQADGNASAPEAWFSRQGLSEMIDQFIAQGMVKLNKGMLESDLKIENGQALVNGKPVPLM